MKVIVIFLKTFQLKSPLVTISGNRGSTVPVSDEQQLSVTLQLPATTTLNETFTEDLRDPTSARFKQIEEAFCDQVHVIFYHPVTLNQEGRGMYHFNL